MATKYDITKRLTTKGRKIRFIGFSQRMAGQDFIADVYYKLSKYEDLEDKLGIDCLTIEKALKVFQLVKDYLCVEEKAELGFSCVVVSVRLPSGSVRPLYITHNKEEIKLLKEVLK